MLKFCTIYDYFHVVGVESRRSVDSKRGMQIGVRKSLPWLRICWLWRASSWPPKHPHHLFSLPLACLIPSCLRFRPTRTIPAPEFRRPRACASSDPLHAFSRPQLHLHSLERRRHVITEWSSYLSTSVRASLPEVDPRGIVRRECAQVQRRTHMNLTKWSLAFCILVGRTCSRSSSAGV